jgi:hypothetical protein
VLGHPNDVLVRTTRTAICGSDLHLLHGRVPDTRVGCTFGHEFTGVVEQVGPSVETLSRDDPSSSRSTSRAAPSQQPFTQRNRLVAPGDDTSYCTGRVGAVWSHTMNASISFISL